MNQEKIGHFISACRKQKQITQLELADQLGITDKAISKWECGRSMPDPSLFLPLCTLLDISLHELLLGEHIPDDQLKEKSNELLMDVIDTWIGKDRLDEQKEQESSLCMLKLTHVKKIYKTANVSTVAINDISFQVGKGKFVGIMGASGSGKSTLLNMIATVDRSTSGTIELDGYNIAELSDQALADFRRDHLGFVFQEYNLLDALMIQENIALALMMKKEPREKIKDTIYEIAHTLGITDILSKYPCEVSGGQRQRCACARTSLFVLV